MLRITKRIITTLLTLTVLLICAATVSFGFDGSGDGTAENPYVITNATELASIADDLDANYVLGDNISMADVTWTPIAGAFTGTFDGAGYQIKELSVTKTSSAFALFQTNDGTIRNLEMRDMAISTAYAAAGIAHENNGTIENCTSTGVVHSKNNSAGGIVYANSGTITDCVNEATVQTDSKHAGGGIAAEVRSNGVIRQCANKGTITGNIAGGILGYSPLAEGQVAMCYNTGSINASDSAGGIVGSAERVTITSCYNVGAVKIEISDSTQIYAGGITGIWGTIQNCYNAGTVDSLNSQRYQSYAGGISGVNATVTNAYNIGKVTAASGRANYVYNGAIQGSGTDVTGCYYYNDSCSTAIGQTDDTEETVALTAADLQKKEKLANLDFNEIWSIDAEAKYALPTLQGLEMVELTNCTDHMLVDVVTKEATCTEDGAASTNCVLCGANTESIVIPAKGHNFSDWNETERATCTEPGRAERQCEGCDLKEYLNTKPFGHDYDHVKKAAGVGVAGKEYDKCWRCGDIQNEVVLPALKPSATTITKLTPVSKGFTAKWSKKAYTGYQLRYSLKSSMASSKTVTITKSSIVSKKVAKLKAKKKYYVQIRTYKTVGGKKYYSAWSAKKSVKTK